MRVTTPADAADTPGQQPRIERIFDVDALLLSNPERYGQLLDAYFAGLGSRVINAAHAIECAEAGQRPFQGDLDDPLFGSHFTDALREVKDVRQARDRCRDQLDRYAAALLAGTRLRNLRPESR